MSDKDVANQLRKVVKDILDAMDALGGDLEYPERRKAMKQLSDAIASAKKALGEVA
jgi:hypothetical protein